MKLKADFSAKGTPENNNCYIRAVATAMNIEYDEALMLCLEAGWDDGMEHDKAIDMAKENGWEVIANTWWHDGEALTEKMESSASYKFPQCSISMLTKLLKQHTDKTFIVFTNDHAFCVKCGKVYDHGRTKANKRAAMFFVVRESTSHQDVVDSYEDFE